MAFDGTAKNIFTKAVEAFKLGATDQQVADAGFALTDEEVAMAKAQATGGLTPSELAISAPQQLTVDPNSLFNPQFGQANISVMNGPLEGFRQDVDQALSGGKASESVAGAIGDIFNNPVTRAVIGRENAEGLESGVTGAAKPVLDAFGRVMAVDVTDTEGGILPNIANAAVGADPKLTERELFNRGTVDADLVKQAFGARGVGGPEQRAVDLGGQGTTASPKVSGTLEGQASGAIKQRLEQVIKNGSPAQEEEVRSLANVAKETWSQLSPATKASLAVAGIGVAASAMGASQTFLNDLGSGFVQGRQLSQKDRALDIQERLKQAEAENAKIKALKDNEGTVIAAADIKLKTEQVGETLEGILDTGFLIPDSVAGGGGGDVQLKESPEEIANAVSTVLASQAGTKEAFLKTPITPQIVNQIISSLIQAGQLTPK